VLSGGSTIHKRPLTPDRLLYVVQQPLGRIASMPATGDKLPSALKSWHLESGRQRMGVV
jgi:hypothetical protein